ncbi:MAG: dicarboxylate--CoA ligase PimA [Candidatus Marinimicrobia bacterium]|nr:dicarboxylate--CoA ligase PimA [Candidatus Neomarinimicrobiota bacterium]
MAATDTNKSSFPWLVNYPDFANWSMALPETPVFKLLQDAVEKFPQNICMEFLGREWTYTQTDEMAAKAAKGFQSLGVCKGTRVGILLPNSPYYVMAFFGVALAGGTVVNMNPLYTVRELEIMASDANIDVLITMDLATVYPKAVSLLGKTPIKKLVVCSMAKVLTLSKAILLNFFNRSKISDVEASRYHLLWDELTDNDGAYTPADIDPLQDIAVLQYTGGTTGLPKGAMLTHANLTTNARQIASWNSAPEYGSESFLAALPFFHVFAMTVVLLCGLECGARIIMLPRFDLKDCLKTIDRKKPTMFPAVPTIYTAINNAPNVERYDLTSLKLCFSGGAALPMNVKYAFEERTGCVVIEGYGLSETSPVVCTNPMIGKNKPGSVGLPMPGTIIEIRSLEDDRLLDLGEKGEICVRGPQVMKGYWNREKETAEAMKGGAFHTGDIGYMDAEGYVFIVDRIKDMINASGYKIYPRVVEEAIQLHPAVEEVVVVGVDDPYRGQTPKAFIKIKIGEQLSEGELRIFLEDKLSTIERPQFYEFRDELPKTLIGKLSKKELREEHAATTTNNV